MKKTNRIISFAVAVLIGLISVTPITSVYAGSEENAYYLGKDSVFKTNKDYEHVKKQKVPKWNLGEFMISGFSRRMESDGKTVFLKSVGDEVELSFSLMQDIDAIKDGKKSLMISDDKKAKDASFDITTNKEFGKGTLLVKKTDYQNKSTYTYYKDYLKGVKKGANTDIQLLEEGDYEVALDYEVRENHINIGPLKTAPTKTHYQMKIEFSIRNGNCMVYPFDVETESELVNTSFTPNGFYVDLAKSRYLNLDVKKMNYVEAEGNLVEDTRFNSAIADGTKFTDEGIYVIKVSNEYTGNTTEKKIYVGTDPILTAYVTTGKDIEYIKEMVSEGAIINEDGTITLPTKEIVETEQEEVSEEEIKVAVNENSKDNAKLKDSSNVGMIVAIVLAVAVILTFVLFSLRKKKVKKPVQKTEETEEDE